MDTHITNKYMANNAFNKSFRFLNDPKQFYVDGFKNFHLSTVSEQQKCCKILTKFFSKLHKEFTFNFSITPDYMWEFTINGIKIRLPNLVGSVETLSKRNIYVLQGNRRQT